MDRPPGTEEEQRPGPGKKVAKGCGCVTLVVALLVCGAGFVAPLTAGFDLLFGWVFFLADASRRVEPNPAAIATAAVILPLVALGVHSFAGWMHAHARPDAPPWRRRASLALVGAIVLSFTAGIGVVGVAHQVAWLATAPELLTDGNFRASREAVAIGALRTITAAQSLLREGDKDGDGRLEFGTLPQLQRAKLVDDVLGSGRKVRYLFEVCPSVTEPAARWFGTAVPEDERAGKRWFFVNHSGTIYFSTTGLPPVHRGTCEAPEGLRPIGS